MPNGATSEASTSLTASAAHFDAAYAPWPATATRPAIDVTFTMQPLRCSRIVGSTAWMHRSVPHRLVFITDWNVGERHALDVAATPRCPALFTRMSTRPSASITDAIPAATDASSSTSTIRSDSGRSPAASTSAAPDASERTVA